MSHLFWHAINCLAGLFQKSFEQFFRVSKRSNESNLQFDLNLHGHLQVNLIYCDGKLHVQIWPWLLLNFQDGGRFLRINKFSGQVYHMPNWLGLPSWTRRLVLSIWCRIRDHFRLSVNLELQIWPRIRNQRLQKPPHRHFG